MKHVLYMVLFVSLCFIFIVVGYGYGYIFPARKINYMRRIIANNKDVARIAQMYDPSDNTRDFIVYIEMRDGTKIVLDYVNADFLFLTFGRIWRIGEWSPEELIYDVNNKDGCVFIHNCGYPAGKNKVFHKALISQSLVYLLKHYREILAEVETLPVADIQEFRKWKSDGFPIPALLQEKPEHGSIIVKVPIKYRVGSAWPESDTVVQ